MGSRLYQAECDEENASIFNTSIASRQNFTSRILYPSLDLSGTFSRAWQQLEGKAYFPALFAGCLRLTLIRVFFLFCFVFVCFSDLYTRKQDFETFPFLFLCAASVEVFLRFLQKEYQWATNSIKTVSSQLAKDDITSVKLLAMCWSDVRKRFPAGMSRMIEKELRKRDMIP